jgi:hypothetical protein
VLEHHGDVVLDACLDIVIVASGDIGQNLTQTLLGQREVSPPGNALRAPDPAQEHRAPVPRRRCNSSGLGVGGFSVVEPVEFPIAAARAQRQRDRV